MEVLESPSEVEMVQLKQESRAEDQGQKVLHIIKMHTLGRDLIC